ncbi:9125_t:CDS:2, partial [Cetraspora pellucida]
MDVNPTKNILYQLIDLDYKPNFFEYEILNECEVKNFSDKYITTLRTFYWFDGSKSKKEKLHLINKYEQISLLIENKKYCLPIYYDKMYKAFCYHPIDNTYIKIYKRKYLNDFFESCETCEKYTICGKYRILNRSTRRTECENCWQKFVTPHLPYKFCITSTQIWNDFYFSDSVKYDFFAVDIENNNVGDSGGALNAAICYKSGGNGVDIDLVEA